MLNNKDSFVISQAYLLGHLSDLQFMASRIVYTDEVVLNYEYTINWSLTGQLKDLLKCIQMS